MFIENIKRALKCYPVASKFNVAMLILGRNRIASFAKFVL